MVTLKADQTNYGYDAVGNRTSITPPTGTATTLSYDQANRLTSYGTAATYQYNGDGRRVSKTVSGTATAFVWDEADDLPLLLAQGSTYYIYGPGGIPIEQLTTSGVQYLHQDGYGSTRLLTDAAGTVVASYTYDPYGNLKAQTGTADTPLRWNGQYQDGESSLYYLRARYYDPVTAQFISRDPLVFITRSIYGYAGGSPLNGADPLGLCWPDWACPVENAISDTASTAWNATGGKVVNFVQNNTIGVCVNVSAGYGGWVGGSGCVALVGGHPTLIGTVGGGIGSPGASLTGGLLISNAHDPQQLTKWFGTAGASADFGPSVGDEYSWGQDSCGNRIWENQFQVGVGVDVPVPVEAHYGASYTWVSPL